MEKSNSSKLCLIIWSIFCFLAACEPVKINNGEPFLISTPSLVQTGITATAATSTITLASANSDNQINEIPEKSTPTASILPTDFTLPFRFITSTPSLQPAIYPQPKGTTSAIQFDRPGPLSLVVSPLVVRGYSLPGYKNRGWVSLVGEDGVLLAEEELQLNTAYSRAFFSWTMPFEIQQVGELGRLSMEIRDEFGRNTNINSVHLILLAQGESIINFPGNLVERCIIEQPSTTKKVTGGSISVSGWMRSFNYLPLVVTLVDRQGVQLASSVVPIAPAENDTYVPFQVDMGYSVSSGTWALLSVTQGDDRISGTMYLTSREIYLNP